MIKIPDNENRKFKYGELSNKMKYTIISDKYSDKANIVMNVRTGWLYDPPKYMGLAHFLEHMLFMGSTKYKGDEYFSEKLNELGGSSNAYTSDTETVYYLDVLSENMEEILDIFSRFFIDPLFNINSASREINAINSEHLKNLNNDFWTIRQLIYNISENPLISKLGTGSHETLGKDINNIRSEMIKFYNNTKLIN